MRSTAVVVVPIARASRGTGIARELQTLVQELCFARLAFLILKRSAVGVAIANALTVALRASMWSRPDHETLSTPEDQADMFVDQPLMVLAILRQLV
mmetsp:Transcript_15663/g.44342  ORF Transcript_15663/g.44342 Transcript_15663/m.44342 type:complete len:97 (-) Transcript_15663:782-1072(-)